MGEGKRKYFEDSDRRLIQPSFGEPPAGGAGAPGSLGAMLRQARASKGLTVDDVGQVLRIRPSYLQALEEGRYKDLPGATYALGFLRTYAEYLSIDPAQAVARFREESSGAIRKSELYMPQPVPEGRIPGGAVLLLALVLAGGIYGGWYYASSTGRDLVDLVPPLPDRIAQVLTPGLEELEGGGATDAPANAPADSPVLAAREPADAGPADAGGAALPAAPEAVEPAPMPEETPQSAAVAEAEPPVTAEPDAPQAPVPAAGESEAPAVASSEATPAPPPAEPETSAVEAGPPADAPPAPEPSTEMAAAPEGSGPEAASAEDEPPLPPAPAEPATPNEAAAAAPAEPPPATGTVYGAADGPARIQLHATQDSWVQVRDAQGDLLFARVLRPGDVYRVPDRSGLTLVTGNAGGLIVSVDGVRRPAPLGETGKVMRGIALDPRSLGGGT